MPIQRLIILNIVYCDQSNILLFVVTSPFIQFLANIYTDINTLPVQRVTDFLLENCISILYITDEMG